MADRPDERLLLRADPAKLPPIGSRLWDGDEWLTVTEHGRDGWIIAAGPCGLREYAPSAIPKLRVDLSAPADGERVDLLPTALGWLNKRFPSERWLSAIESISVPNQWFHLHRGHAAPRYAVGNSRGGRECAFSAGGDRPPRWPRKKPVHAIDPWPDLTGLSDADAARAVVVAALGVARG